VASKEEVLKNYQEALPTGAVLGFFEAHRPLSNFHLEPFTMYGVTWPCSENAYQFSKLMMPSAGDITFFTQCRPEDAKHKGGEVLIRSNWEAIKIEVMTVILEHKFKQCPVARACLLGTTGKLVEANWWGDVFWGTCDGQGINVLGKVLMNVRNKLNRGEL
jgi:ribA/ribD-fused uncharacterized protein